MTRAHSVTLVFEYACLESAAVVERSVELEVNEIEGDRTHAELSRVGSELTVRVGADDLTALRAGLNTWTTLVEVAESVAAVEA